MADKINGRNYKEKTITDTTSASGNITLPVDSGYKVISAWCDSVSIRFTLFTVYQNITIARITDHNLSPLTNTLVEVHYIEVKN